MRDGSGGVRYFHRNHQYSITALTNSGGSITERYAYTAYGAPTITDASGTPRSSTAEGNRYTYTGREWDDEAELYHYRARWFDPLSGRFCSRDPIDLKEAITELRPLANATRWRTDAVEAVSRQRVNLYQYVGGQPLSERDPSGLLFGFGYGNFCGWSARGQNGPPIDALDAACQRHDKCQATGWTCNPYHLSKCSYALCDEALDEKGLAVRSLTRMTRQNGMHALMQQRASPHCSA